jgi:hypothetical protein
MPSLSYILVERLDSFGSFENLQSVLHHIKALGYGVSESTPNVGRNGRSSPLYRVHPASGRIFLTITSVKASASVPQTLECETALYAVSKSVPLLLHSSALFWWLAKCKAS